MRTVIPVQLPEDQAKAVSEAASESGLSQQDVIRQTLKFYLPDFRERMSVKPKRRGFLSLWDALHFGKGLELEIKPMPGKVKQVTL